jgi:hypothetical protein
MNTTQSQNAFQTSFDSYACFGDTITAEIDGFTVTARISHDEVSHIDDDDCHSLDQSATGADDEMQEQIIAARKAWFDGQWCYCGLILSVFKNGIELNNCATSLWGIELNYPHSDENKNENLTEIANDLLAEISLTSILHDHLALLC